jgi:hypothetical protein
MTLSYLGFAHWANADLERAQSCLATALEMGVKSGASPILATSLPGMAMVYAEMGRAQRAQELVDVVMQCCGFLVDSKWFADVAGPGYHDAMGALTDEELAEAEHAVLLSDMRTEAEAVLADLAA